MRAGAFLQALFLHLRGEVLRGSVDAQTFSQHRFLLAFFLLEFFDVFVTLGVVHVFQVPAQIATLREILLTDLTFKRSLASVLSEVVPQIAALLKDAFAVFEAALEVELYTLGLGIPNFDSLMPRFGNAFKSVGVDVVCLTRL